MRRDENIRLQKENKMRRDENKMIKNETSRLQNKVNRLTQENQNHCGLQTCQAHDRKLSKLEDLEGMAPFF